MIGNENMIGLDINEEAKCMTIRYTPRSERTLYDLCDLNGRVVLSGGIHSQETTLDFTNIKGSRFVMLIVDGDQVVSKRVNLLN